MIGGRGTSLPDLLGWRAERRRHGVYHADMNVDDMELATLQAAVATAAAYGVSLEMIHIEPYIAGGHGMAAITAAEEPGREEAIQSILRMIQNAGRAGIRGLNYNFHPIGDHGSGNQRTADTFGRGGPSPLPPTPPLRTTDRPPHTLLA